MKSNDTLKRTGCLRRLITAVVIISALLAIFLIGLQINQQIGLAKFYRENPPPGRLFTINGHAMHLHCLGNGTPTVIIDAGNSSYSVEWRPLQERLSTNLRVCTFDRPGYGWSESSSAVRDGEQVVRELHELLQTAGEMGPYILVGHSLGGVHVRLYAAAYPQETAGLVLVDTAMPLLVTPEFEQQMASSIGFYRVVQILSGSGLMRLIGPLGGEDAMPANAKKLPAGIQEIYLQMALDARQYTTAIAEMTVLAKTFEQTQASLVGEQPFGDLPVIVLTAGLTFADGATPFDERLAMVEPAQIERQAALARLSKRGEQRLIAKSGHAMHLDAPEAIIQAALDLVASLR